MTNTESKTKVYIALGSNLGDRRAAIAAAIELLKEQVDNLHVSNIYETEPWGVLDQPVFLNACVGGLTSLRPDELLHFVKDVEATLGRKKRTTWGPREIDVDILFYGEEVINKPNLVIPHPYLPQRSFVLVPLRDIAPDVMHPVLKKSVSAMAAELGDSGLTLFAGQ